MAADDYLNTPSDPGFPAELDTSSSMSGNRPASGSRRATPGEVLSQGFQGAQNAGDFLGLDVEFTASQDPQQAYSGQPLDLVPPPTIQADDGYASEPAPLPAGDAVQEFAQAPSAFEFGEDLGSEDGEGFQAEVDAPSKRPLFVGALLFAGLTAGGVFYGPSLYSRFIAKETTVAERPEPRKEGKPPKAGATTPVVATPGADVVPQRDPAPSRVVPESSTGTPVQVGDVPRTAVEPAPTLVAESEPSEDVVGLGAVVPEERPASTSTNASVLPRPVSFPELDGAAYAWASEDQLELIWRGSEVPLEAVRAPAKTLMPRVGNVRVLTTAGDVFEGRLYAVGQNRVWLDTQPGRVGLDGDKVERIDVLPPEAGQSSGQEVLVAGSKRVRVQAPGGMLYGRVLKAEGEEVTLALDQGGRVRVKAGDVQDLGSGRAIVVGR